MTHGKNLVYQTDAIAAYFAEHRVRWDQFYQSERDLISRLSIGPETRVLDIGCGCGGLGLSLQERFGITDYTGVEINAQAAAAGRTLNPSARIFGGDFLELRTGSLLGSTFDIVFSLSCVDWNIQFVEMLRAAWDYVRPGGYFVATFRLTTAAGCDDMSRSYQFINYEGRKEGELAAYVVLNAADLGMHLAAFLPSAVVANGYWGSPSVTAVTPYDRLCFVALAVRKPQRGVEAPTLDLSVPAEIRDQLIEALRRDQ